MTGAIATQAPVLAVDIGASHTRFALVADGAITVRSETHTASLAGHPRGIADGIVPALERFLGEAASSSVPTIVATGIGIAATIDGEGSVIEARPFGVQAGPGLRDSVAARLGVPVFVENDANVAALAEHRYGAARGRDHAAILTLGTNIGLGLILDGRLYRGGHGAAGEVGLLLVPVARANETPDGSTDHGRRTVDGGRFGTAASAAPQGYAWIEELVGGGALAAAAGGREVIGTTSVDALDRAVVDRAIEGWAFVIANLAAVLDPGVVVLVGDVAVDAADLLPRLQRRVAELVALAPEVRLGALGPDAQLLGADLLARAAVQRGATNHARAGLSAQSVGG